MSLTFSGRVVALLTLLLLAFAAPASAQELVVGSGVYEPISTNACAAYPLYLDFAAGAPLQCYDTASTSAPPSFTGLTSTPGTLGGAGASVTNIPNGSGGLTGITSGNALTSAAGLFVEPATSNIIELSKAFTGAPWVQSGQSVTAATSTGPNGVTDGVTFTGSATFGATEQPVTFTTGVPEVCTVWYKNTGASANQKIASFLINDPGHGAVEAGITDTNVGGTGGVSSIGFVGPVSLTSFEQNLNDPATGLPWTNGWVQYVLHLSQTSTPVNTIDLIVAAGTYSGTSSSGDTIFAWHANCGPGNHAFDLPNTSNSAAVTRTGDVLTQAVPVSGQSTIATATYNGTHQQQLGPNTTLNLASALDAWAGTLPLNHVVITTPLSVPALAAAQGFNTLTDYVAPQGFTADNVDLNATLGVGYQFYIGAFFGQSASTYTNQLALTGGNLKVGGSTSNAMLVTATAIPGSPFYRGFVPGGGMYMMEISSTPIIGSQFAGTIVGTQLTVNALNQGTPTVGGSGVGDELYVATVDQGVHLASGGPTTYTLSGTPSGGNIGPTSMTSAYSQGGGWNAPLWHMCIEHLDGGGLDQWIGQVVNYANYCEQDTSEQFGGNFGAFPWDSSYTGHNWYSTTSQNTSHAFQQQLYSSNATVDMKYEEVWKVATPTVSGSWSVYYNGVLNGTNSWTRYIQDTFLTTGATSTSQSTVTLNAPCNSDVTGAANLNVVDTTTSKLAAGVAGTVSSVANSPNCTVTMTGNSAIAIGNGDTVVLVEKPTPVGKTWDMGIVDIQHPDPVTGCSLLLTFPCTIKTVQIWQTSDANNLRN